MGYNIEKENLKIWEGIPEGTHKMRNRFSIGKNASGWTTIGGFFKNLFSSSTTTKAAL